MKLLKQTLLFCLSLCLSLPGSAQKLLNGSLEPSGAISSCTAVPIATFNGNMGNAWITGLAKDVLLNDSSCTSGKGTDGKRYAGLRYTFSMTTQEDNILMMKLDQPMLVDSVYTLTFDYKVDTTGGHTKSGGVFVGYTTDTSKHDTVSKSQQLNAAVWTHDTVKIIPKLSSQYIWFEAASIGGLPLGTFLVYVDNFVLTAPKTVGIGQITADNAALNIYPNPVHDKLQFNLSPNVAMPCRLDITDISGRIVKTEMLEERSGTIDCGQMCAGVYYLQVTDHELRRYFSKLNVD